MKAMRAMKGLAVIVALGAFLSSSALTASAGTMRVSCARGDGKIVLKIGANQHAAHGLHRAMEASAIAQNKLGVTCTDSAATDATVHHRVRLACTNADGDTVLKLTANEHAFKGLSIAVRSFAKHAAARLGVTCEVTSD